MLIWYIDKWTGLDWVELHFFRSERDANQRLTLLEKQRPWELFRVSARNVNPR